MVDNKKERLTMDNKWIDTELFNFILDHFETYGVMPTAFISGAISGRMNSYKSYFDEAVDHFREIYIESYNPSVIDIRTPWETAMEETLSQLRKCDFVYVLKNWENSKGVKIEIERAKELDIPIFYE